MASISTPTTWQRFFFGWASFLAVVAFLHWTQAVLIPIVLAILLTFVLSPVVNSLHRLGLGRVLATVLVETLAVSAVAGLLIGVILQLRALAVELPEHKPEITRKIASLQGLGQGTWLESISDTVRYVNEQLRARKVLPVEEREPVPVTVEPAGLPALLQNTASPAIEGLVSAGLVIVLVAFMLIHRETLRNRFLRLVSDGSLTSVTRAVDDASRRISRFLLMQLLINAGFGTIMAIGLHLIGIPYAFLWGSLAAVLRYIPYVGSLIAGTLPVLLSIAVLPGWSRPVCAGGFIIALELVTANVVEPLLFGQSIGVSEVALLISAAFWAWLWGPIGLVLSTPIVACLVVLGRYVPHFEFFHVLLGDTLVLEPHLAYYQRLLARDAYEAADVLESQAAAHSPGAAAERVIVPALVLAQESRDSGELTASDEEFILQTTRSLVEEILPPAPAAHEGDGVAAGATGQPSKAAVVGCPARDEADELALELPARLPGPAAFEMEIASPKLLFAEIVARIQETGAGGVLVLSLSPHGLPQVRYLCKRLRSQLEGIKILAACWGLNGDVERIRGQLLKAGADHVSTSLSETLEQLRPLAQFLAHAPDTVTAGQR